MPVMGAGCFGGGELAGGEMIDDGDESRCNVALKVEQRCVWQTIISRARRKREQQGQNENQSLLPSAPTNEWMQRHGLGIPEIRSNVTPREWRLLDAGG